MSSTDICVAVPPSASTSKRFSTSSAVGQFGWRSGEFTSPRGGISRVYIKLTHHHIFGPPRRSHEFVNAYFRLLTPAMWHRKVKTVQGGDKE